MQPNGTGEGKNTSIDWHLYCTSSIPQFLCSWPLMFTQIHVGCGKYMGWHWGWKGGGGYAIVDEDLENIDDVSAMVIDVSDYFKEEDISLKGGNYTHIEAMEAIYVMRYYMKKRISL